jgi:type VI secretion system protein ImpC
MSTDRDRFRVELDVDAGVPRRTTVQPEVRVGPSPSGPFRIAVIGDFSARAHRNLVETGRTLATRRPVRVDRDDVDEAIAHFSPTLTMTLSPEAEPLAVSFASLDEFHPDSLFQRLPMFRALRDAGARAVAGASLRAPAVSGSTDTPAGVLDAILGDVPLPPGGAAVARSTTRPALEPDDAGLSHFVAQAVAGHIVKEQDQAERTAQERSDDVIAATMRALLHDREFQSLEALWRGVALLASRLDTDATLQIHLVDISAPELAADLSEAAPDESGTYKLLAGGNAGPWALIVAALPLGDDPALLARLGAVARDLGAPLLGGAHPILAGTEDLGATPDPDDWTTDESREWLELRASMVAPYIGLVFPRVLLRLPYGKSAEPCDLFSFEELVPGAHPAHDNLLWGSGAIVGALAVGQGFAEGGWNLRPAREISGFPLHVYRVNEEAFAVPCAEVTIGERSGERLLDRGLSPLLAVRDSDALILPMLQSIAARRAPLRGRWNQEA